MNDQIEFQRLLELDLPKGQSAFLWGARKSGKSTYLKQRFPESPYFDLLKTDLQLDLLRSPQLFRERLLALGEQAKKVPVIIDEVQKVPALLDEVHWLIENAGYQFILCGSSARKLKRGRANLLGGRAWRCELHPLTTAEVPGFDLLTAINRGLLPDHYVSAHHRKFLKAYTQDYLKEEVFAEGLVRNTAAFSRFFEAAGYSAGEIVNFSNIARDCGVDSKTVKEHFQILVDTLLGYLVESYKTRADRHVIARSPKFYPFDVGVANYMAKRRIEEMRGEAFGKSLEHLVFMELIAHRSYRGGEHEIRYWRTRAGREVDFVLGEGEIAIEVKGSSRLDRKELRALKLFRETYQPRRAIVVTNEAEPRVHDGIEIMPWRRFFDELWADQVLLENL